MKVIGYKQMGSKGQVLGSIMRDPAGAGGAQGAPEGDGPPESPLH